MICLNDMINHMSLLYTELHKDICRLFLKLFSPLSEHDVSASVGVTFDIFKFLVLDKTSVHIHVLEVFVGYILYVMYHLMAIRTKNILHMTIVYEKCYRHRLGIVVSGRNKGIGEINLCLVKIDLGIIEILYFRIFL